MLMLHLSVAPVGFRCRVPEPSGPAEGWVEAVLLSPRDHYGNPLVTVREEDDVRINDPHKVEEVSYNLPLRPLESPLTTAVLDRYLGHRPCELWVCVDLDLQRSERYFEVRIKPGLALVTAGE